MSKTNRKSDKFDRDQPVKFPGDLRKLASIEAERLGLRKGITDVLRTWARIGQETKPQLEGVRP